MKTMNAHPSVNHVPTQIGGVGTRSVADFYTSKFIFQNPAMDVTPVSRTIGENGGERRVKSRAEGKYGITISVMTN